MKLLVFIVFASLVPSTSNAWVQGTYNCSGHIYKISPITMGGRIVPFLEVNNGTATSSGFPVLYVTGQEESLTLWEGAFGYGIKFENGKVEKFCKEIK